MKLKPIYILYLLCVLIIGSCSEDHNHAEKGTVMQIVKIKTNLSEAEFIAAAKKREPQFEAIPGIVQKYYLKLGGSGEYGGVYIWDSEASIKAFKETTLAKTIGEAYGVIEPPSVEIVEILFQLRD